MAHLLGAEQIALEFPTIRVLDSVTIGIEEGDRIGIVGRNGDGKSTLMSVLAGRLTPDSGRVTVRGGVRIGMLDQRDALDPSQTVGHAVVGDVPEHTWARDPRIRDIIGGLLGDVEWNAQTCSSTSPPTTSISKVSPGWPSISRSVGPAMPADWSW